MKRNLMAIVPALVLMLAFSAWLVAPIGAVPTFTGDAIVDFTGAGVVKLDDPSSAPGVPDVGLPGQFPSGTISGWDINAVYVEYDYAADMLYVGIDCFVICGDADSDGDPGTSGPILTGLQGADLADFAGSEAVTVLFDTDNDFTGSGGDFEAVVGVANGQNITTFGAYNFVGTPGNPSFGFSTALTNTVALFQTPSAAAPDLEFSIANFSTLPGFTFTPGEGFAFKINAFMGSLEDDGIGEDFMPGPNSSIPVQPPPPTPTPTATATEIPTETPVPPTATPTLTPTLPPPTDMPPTGADLLGRALSVSNLPEDTDGRPAIAPLSRARYQPLQPLIAKYNRSAQAHYPQRVEIPAIKLDTTVLPMGWRAATNTMGETVSEWDVVANAAGWHLNSALPGGGGNVVFSGHNNIDGAVFRDLHQMRKGQEITVWLDDGAAYTYIVDEVLIEPHKFASEDQRAQNAAWIGAFDDERLTLVTCWPAYSDTHRVIVVARPQQSD